MVVEQPFRLSQLENGVAVAAVKLPAKSRVLGGGVRVTQVFNSSASDELKVGDTGVTDRYSATPVNLQTLGFTPLYTTGYQYTDVGSINLIWSSGGGVPTTGTGVLIVEYVTDEGYDWVRV